MVYEIESDDIRLVYGNDNLLYIAANFTIEKSLTSKIYDETNGYSVVSMKIYTIGDGSGECKLGTLLPSNCRNAFFYMNRSFKYIKQ